VFLIQAVILNDCRFRALQELAHERNAALEESLQFHKILSELDTHLQWVKEKLGQILHQAQSLEKKHRNLEEEEIGYQPMISRTFASGQAPTGQAHPKIKQVWTNILLT